MEISQNLKRPLVFTALTAWTQSLASSPGLWPEPFQRAYPPSYCCQLGPHLDYTSKTADAAGPPKLALHRLQALEPSRDTDTPDKFVTLYPQPLEGLSYTLHPLHCGIGWPNCT